MFKPLLVSFCVSVGIATVMTSGPSARAEGASSGQGDKLLDGITCISDCACVKQQCPSGDHSCTACWFKEHTRQSCSPSDDEKAKYGNYCPQSTRTACITDCACVLKNCPAGNTSCTACWWTQGTTQSCNPTDYEKQKYGFSCSKSAKN